MRTALCVLLVILGAALIPFGTVALYARGQIVEPEAFADRAVEALDRDAVREAVEQEVAGSLPALGGRLDGPAVRALARPRIDAVIRSSAFRRVFRAAVLDTNRRFFVDERVNATVDLAAVAPLLRAELRSVSPRLARAFPRELDVQLVVLRRDELPGGDLLTADDVRTLGVVLPLLTLAAFAGALAVATSRARALLGIGIAALVAAALLAGGLFLSRAAIPAVVESEGRLTEPELEDAVEELFDVYAGDLYVWALVIGVAGLALVLASSLGRRARAT